MVTRVDPLLAMLISSLRELPAPERHRMMLSERRKILSSSKSDPCVKYSNILKSIYMGMLSCGANEIDFLNACESDVLRIKTVGYLGMMMMESNEHVIMMINTIMKDLGRKETRNDALTAICNLRDDNMVLRELSKYICPKSRTDLFHEKSLVALSRLNPEAKMSVVGQDEGEIYIKIQIVLDLFVNTGELSFTENDILFLNSLFIRSTNPFLRVKLLQLFKVFCSKNLLVLENDLLSSIEALIISSRDKIRPQVEIALAIEAAELMLDMNRSNARVEALVFRLIESPNPNSRYFGLRMVRRYKIHKDIAIDRCVKVGMHDKDCLRTLVSLVNKNSCKAIQRRREEMVFYMENAGASRQTINTALVAVFSKIVQHMRDEFLIKTYQEIPELCLKIPFDRNIPREHALKLFNRICVTVNTRYFPLVYQLLSSGARNGEFYSLMFERHLNILVIKRDKEQERDTLIRLLDCILSFGIVERNRDILISKYQDIVGENNVSDVLDLILNTIYLMNAKLRKQVLNIVGGCFMYFSVCRERNEITFHPQQGVQLSRVSDEGLDLERVSGNTYEMKHGSLRMEILIDCRVHVLNLEV